MAPHTDFALHRARHDPQVMLKWAIQKGYCVIPGSGNPEHMVSNLEIYGADLSAEDMAKLDGLRDHAGFFYMDMREQGKAMGGKDAKDEP